MIWAITIGAILISYVLGSIPTGLWLGLWLRNIDIRHYGSKNIGATNTLRILGKKLGITALVADMLKGALAVGVGYLAVNYFGAYGYTHILCGVAAIAGHIFSMFIGFKGGKGVATSTGVFLALAWQPTLIAAAVFLAVVAATRMVSAGSLAAAVALAVAAYVFSVEKILLLIIVIVAVLIIIKHRANIGRILTGTESRLGQRPNQNSFHP